MGYPMTWKRLVNRNGLNDGDYHNAPLRHAAGINTEAGTLDPSLLTALPEAERVAAARASDLRLSMARAERLKQYENSFRILAGDLRRLEQDAVDERAICRGISYKTGIDAEVVAAVIGAFLDY